jgi:peptidyl-prolyl cis-trans isomerase SurA
VKLLRKGSLILKGKNRHEEDSRLETSDLRLDTLVSRVSYVSGLVLFLVFSLCWITASEAKIVEKILFIVNDDIITKTELDERLSKEKQVLKQLFQYDEARLSEEMEKARPEILELIIDEILFTQEAIKKGIQVSDAEIQQFITSLRNQYGSAEAFEQALKAEGYTLDSFRKEKKKTLLLQRLIEQKFGQELIITDEEVSQFYRENRDEFPGRSDTVRLKHIFIKFHTTEADREIAFQRAENILKRCKEGADFGEMAAEVSDHELTKESGGDMGYFIPGMGEHDPKLEEAASQLAVGEISDLIETPGGYDIIKVTDIKANRVRAQRIFIAIWPTPASEEAAEQKANLVLEELTNGADFVSLVRKYSDDPLSKDKDGDWKAISMDAMSPGLRGAFDSFDEGEISRPFKTPFGFHIFKVTERQDLTDDEMEQLRELLRQKRLQEKLSEYSKKLREKAYIQKLAED